jgi:cytidylate kinase
MLSIAVDGPSGAGKSSVCKEIARRLNINYLDTGAIYRSVAYELLKERVEFRNIDKFLQGLTINISYEENAQKMNVNGVDITDKIRTPEVTMMASKVAALPQIRSFLLGLQRDIAAKEDVIIDGRDIGTVVLPSATVKIFLTADTDERAKRRCTELREKGMNVDFERVKADIQTRDYDDENREIAPTKKADDAILVDTSNLNFEEVLESLIKIINIKTGKKENVMPNELSEIAARIRELRDVCGYTADELADELRVDRVTYSEYEAGGNFPISVIYEIANKFKVDFNELVTGEESRLDSYQVIRRGGGRAVSRFTGYRYKDLAFKMKHKIMQPLLVTLDPSDEEAKLVTHPGEEFNLVLKGRVAVTINNKTIILEEGDSIYFNSLLPHGQRCAGNEKSRFVTIISERNDDKNA